MDVEEREKLNKKISGSLKDYWSSLTPEKLAGKKVTSPTGPERWLGWYLEDKYPGEWAYNGNCDLGIIVGGRIPDFVNVNGLKVVIEVFGYYWHKPEDEEKKIKHYKKFGYECIVIWEYDCYDFKSIPVLIDLAMSKEKD